MPENTYSLKKEILSGNYGEVEEWSKKKSEKRLRKKLELDAEITARWSNDISIKKHVILCNIDYFKEEMLMKLTSDEFNELQRWIEVRDSCQEAKAKLRQAANYANSHNYDKKNI